MREEEMDVERGRNMARRMILMETRIVRRSWVGMLGHAAIDRDSRWIDGWMDGWMDGWLDACMDAWMDGWMDACMDAWMDGWMDGQCGVAVAGPRS
jgi:hypothetical protein